MAVTLVALYNGQDGAGVYGIGAATSPDGLDWTTHLSNPIITHGSSGVWDDDHVKDPCLISDASTLVCYYSGHDGSHYRIGRATAGAVSGPWTKSGQVLDLGASGAFDDAGVIFPTVLHEPADIGREWKMWYAGLKASDGRYRIGYAWSTDGLTWTKVGQVINVGTSGAWDDEGVVSTAIVKDGSTYTLFYGGTSRPGGDWLWQGGYATFTDPEGTYTKGAGNPTLRNVNGTDPSASVAFGSNVALGATVIHPTATSHFVAGQAVVLGDTTSDTEVHTVASIDTSTQLTLDEPTVSAFTTADSARIRPLDYLSVQPRSVLELDSGWEMYATAFQPVADVAFAGTSLREGSLRYTSSTLTGSWTRDDAAGLLFPMFPANDGWDRFSAENMSVIEIGEADVDPDAEYVPPAPSGALIEIRAAAPGSSRWGIALWGVGTWSPAGWQDVTPESVDARIRWGSHSPERGVLAETEAGSWIVNTYDPERLLDPGNLDGPYAADLRAGLPIRVRHRGTIIRQGVAETIAFFHKDTRGGIRVTDAVSLYARSTVPADSPLSDTLRARARDAIAAAGLAVNVEPDPPTGDPALAPRLEDERSVWRHIADAALQVLHVPYIDRLGVLRFRAWSAPYDRGRGVDATQLINLGTLVATKGLYSVVQARQTIGDGGDVIERRLTPTPRYGSVPYLRDDATPDAGGWADAVLADRSLQTVQWIPGEVYPLDAAAVEYFATLETLERLAIDDVSTDPAVNVTGIIVGGEISVTAKKDSEALWRFTFELAQTATSPLYTDTDPPEFLRNEAGDAYLYGD